MHTHSQSESKRKSSSIENTQKLQKMTKLADNIVMDQLESNKKELHTEKKRRQGYKTIVKSMPSKRYNAIFHLCISFFNWTRSSICKDSFSMKFSTFTCDITVKKIQHV